VTSLDYVVLTVVALCVLLSMIRGAVRELLSIVSWVVAVFLAIHFSASLATFLPASLSNSTVRTAVSFIAILLGSLLVLALITMLLSRLIKQSPLSGTDRLLGGLFGLGRAVVILTVLALIAGLTSIPREAFWRDARSRPLLELSALWVRGYLPQAVASRIHYD